MGRIIRSSFIYGRAAASFRAHCRTACHTPVPEGRIVIEIQEFIVSRGDAMSGSSINTQKILLFLGLTFVLSWLLPLAFFLAGGKWNTLPAMGMALAYMFMPALSALIVQKFMCRQPMMAPLGITWNPNRWWLAAWLLPPLCAFATIGVSLLLPGVTFSPGMEGLAERFHGLITPEQLAHMKSASPIHPFWLALIQGLIAGITINAVAATGEEIGWRGMLLRELRAMSFWKSSVLIGAVWGIWHAPLIVQGHNYPQHPVLGVFMMTLWCTLLAPIVGYVRLKGKSVLAASIIHGSLNATAGLALMVVKGGSDLTVGLTGLSGFIVLIIVNLGIFLLDRSFMMRPVRELLEAPESADLQKEA
jgi:uncharacterized protein